MSDDYRDESMRYKQNRELSWLKFNERVMQEAEDDSVPLVERLRFLSIFTTNLDEFFRVRVGNLVDMMALKKNYHDNKTGMTAKEQIDEVYKEVRPLYEKREKLYFNLEHQLRQYGICRLRYSELDIDEENYIKTYFQDEIFPMLSPIILDAHHPFPHLPNKQIQIIAVLRTDDNKQMLALLPVPETLPEVIFIPERACHYISTEDLLLEMVDTVFDAYQIEEKVQMCITRNADIHAEDEEFDVDDDFRQVMKEMLNQRKHLAPVRMELSGTISDALMGFLQKRFGLKDRQVFTTMAPMRLNYAYPLGDQLPPKLKKALTYPEYTPQWPAAINPNKSMWNQVLQKDFMLSYPYDAMDPFIRLVEEAADSEEVLSIQITIYRLAGKSRLVNALCKAAENGKEVTALIELRARFDEQNNIDWSRRMEKAGCNIIYGIQNYKVHSKVCLITYRDDTGIHYITQVGTGNYNEKTAKLYTDLCLMTANQAIGRDARVFFQNMGIGNLYGQYKELLVSPVSLKSRVMEMMDEEIAKGPRGQMFFKMNSLTDKDILDKLAEASQAGVRTRMVIRGICCLRPGMEGLTDNVEVRSIVGRYLEHSRIYSFGTGDDEKLYISSADFMTRNTERRVEVACPVYAPETRAKVHRLMEVQWKDTLKAHRLRPDGTYENIEGDPYDAQSEQMNIAVLEGEEYCAKLDQKAEKKNIEEMRRHPRNAEDSQTKHIGLFARLFGRNK